MKRLKRVLLNSLTALSLLLCVAVVALWVRSYWIGSMVGYRSERLEDGWYDNTYLASYSGRISFISLRQIFGTDVVGGVARGHGRSGFTPGHGGCYGSTDSGVCRVRSPTSSGSTDRVDRDQDAALGDRHRVRSAPGLRAQQAAAEAARLACGYDLRATPQRCPECGASAAIEKRPEA